MKNVVRMGGRWALTDLISLIKGKGSKISDVKGKNIKVVEIDYKAAYDIPDDDIEQVLEGMIDHHTFRSIVGHLIEIAYNKEDHLLCNWGDKGHAFCWKIIAGRLEKVLKGMPDYI